MIRAHEANVERLESELATLRNETTAFQATTENKQLELSSGESKVEKRRMQLREASSNVEFQALKDEIAAAEMANSVLADETLEALEKVDEMVAKLDHAKDTLAAARSEADRTRQGFEQEVPRIRADIERLEAELKQCESDLPGDFRENYFRAVQHKGEDGLAEVEGKFCSGCNQQIPLNRINDLLLSRPLSCPACGRLLYLPEGYSPD